MISNPAAAGVMGLVPSAAGLPGVNLGLEDAARCFVAGGKVSRS